MPEVITHKTHYGLISIFRTDWIINHGFERGLYWNENNFLNLKQYINPSKNILEIGGHVGTDSILYAQVLDDDKKIFVFEPQREIYKLLEKNIIQNNLQEKIIPFNKGVFSYTGTGEMNKFVVDGDRGSVIERNYDSSTTPCISDVYENDNHQPINIAGLPLGKGGESIELITIDEMRLDDIGFIHCDAQGSENFIFYSGKETIRKNRPVIYFEDNTRSTNRESQTLCNVVNNSYIGNNSINLKASQFDLVDYCFNELKYSQIIRMSPTDILLIPSPPRKGWRSWK